MGIGQDAPVSQLWKMPLTPRKPPRPSYPIQKFLSAANALNSRPNQPRGFTSRARPARPNQSAPYRRQRGQQTTRTIQDRAVHGRRSKRRPAEEREGIFRLAGVARRELPTRGRVPHGLADRLQLVVRRRATPSLPGRQMGGQQRTTVGSQRAMEERKRDEGDGDGREGRKGKIRLSSTIHWRRR